MQKAVMNRRRGSIFDDFPWKTCRFLMKNREFYTNFWWKLIDFWWKIVIFMYKSYISMYTSTERPITWIYRSVLDSLGSEHVRFGHDFDQKLSKIVENWHVFHRFFIDFSCHFRWNLDRISSKIACFSCILAISHICYIAGIY